MKWSLKLLLTVSALAFLIQGCGSADSGTNNKPAANSQSNEKVDLNFYNFSNLTQQDFDDYWGDLIRKKFPNVNPVYVHHDNQTYIRNLIAAGTPVDIMYDSIGYFYDDVINPGMALDMTDLIKKNKIDLSHFEPSLVDAMKSMSKGGLYGIPYSNNTMVMYYNRDLFDKFGVPYPKDGMTWDAMIDLGNKLTRVDQGQTYLGLALTQIHSMRMNQYSLGYLDPKTMKPTIMTDTNWVNIINTYMVAPATSPIYRAYIVSNKNKVPGTNEFTQTKNLALLGTVSNFMTGADIDKTNWDMVSMPVLKDKPGVGMQSYPSYIGVTATSKHKDIAMDVVSYLVSDEAQTLMAGKGAIPSSTNPAIRQALASSEKLKGKNVIGALYTNKLAPIAYKSSVDPDVETVYYKHVVDLILQKTDINTLIRQANEDAEKKIADANSK